MTPEEIPALGHALHGLMQWQIAGYTVVLSGQPGPRTGAQWVCSVVKDDPNDTATGVNDSLVEALRIALRLALQKWGVQ